MSCEAEGTLQPPERLRTEVDVHRANRELERWLNIDLDAPRADQRGYNSPITTPGLPPDWRDRAKLSHTLIYTHIFDEQGNIVDVWVEREPVSETEPQPEK